MSSSAVDSCSRRRAVGEAVGIAPTPPTPIKEEGRGNNIMLELRLLLEEEWWPLRRPIIAAAAAAARTRRGNRGRNSAEEE